MMDARERVLIALNHKEPDRVPIDLGSFAGGTSINVHAYQNLLRHLGLRRSIKVDNVFTFTAEVDVDILNKFSVDTKSVRPSVPLRKFNAPRTFIDQAWNVTWKRSSDFTYAPVEGPFRNIGSPSLSDLKKFRWPRASEVEDFVKWKKKAEDLRTETDRALVARMPVGIVTGTQILRGFQQWMEDLYLNRRFSDGLLEKYTEIWIDIANGMLEALGDNVDVLIWGDDLGIQTQPMISPKIFRERIKPLIKRQVESIKAKTKAKVAFHSCGSVYDLIEDFIEIGIDVLNPLQATAKHMEAKEIKKKAGKQLALWGGIDTHFVLPKGKPRDVKDVVKRTLSELGEGGGYILSGDHNILIDVPPENLIAMFEAAAEYGKYS